MSVLQCVAVCCSVLQWVAMCCSVLSISRYAFKMGVLQCVAVCCNVLQRAEYLAVHIQNGIWVQFECVLGILRFSIWWISGL